MCSVRFEKAVVKSAQAQTEKIVAAAVEQYMEEEQGEAKLDASVASMIQRLSVKQVDISATSPKTAITNNDKKEMGVKLASIISRVGKKS